jgi:hypothetical protein
LRSESPTIEPTNWLPASSGGSGPTADGTATRTPGRHTLRLWKLLSPSAHLR